MHYCAWSGISRRVCKGRAGQASFARDSNGLAAAVLDRFAEGPSVHCGEMNYGIERREVITHA
jgi:hypothetical protein